MTPEYPNALLRLRLLDSEADSERLEQMTARLRRELRELDVDAVEPERAGQAPIGARAGELAELGTLLVNATTAPAVLGAVVTTIRAWLRHQSQRSVEMEFPGGRVVITGRSSSAELERIAALVRDPGSDVRD